MSINLSTALSGVSSANERLRASSSATVAASASPVKAEVPAPRNAPIEPPVAVVEPQSATYAFVANLRVLETQLRAAGVMLDIHA